jgi:hypothetical protein
MWQKSILLIGAAALFPVLAQDNTQVSFPTGEGEPLAITCRAPQKLSDSRLFGPKVCKTNAEWAQYRKDGMDVSADGVRDVPSEKWRSLNTTGCRENPPGGGGTTNFAYTTLSPLCF